MGEFLTIDDRGPVRWVVMSNPGRRNAVPRGGWEELAAAFYDFETSDARVLVLTGADGDFCSGAELDPAMAADSAAVNVGFMAGPNAAATALHRLSKPTIAAVDGVAVGGGMNLALGCDLVVCTGRARFSEIFVRRGLTLDVGGSWLLPRIVGLARAREIALTGRIVEAGEALAIGMVVEVVAPARLEARVTELAEELARGAPLSHRFIKRALDRSATMSFEQALAFEEQAQAILLGSEDLREAVQAFADKREPDFRGE